MAMTNETLVLTKTTKARQTVEFFRAANGHLIIALDGVQVHDREPRLAIPETIPADMCDKVGIPHRSGVYSTRYGDAPQIAVTPDEISTITTAMEDHTEESRNERADLVRHANSFDLADTGEMPDNPDAEYFARRRQILQDAESAAQAVRDWDAQHPEVAAEIEAERRQRIAQFLATD